MTSIPDTGEVKFSQIQSLFGGTANNIQLSKYYSDHSSNYTLNIAGIPMS